MVSDGRAAGGGHEADGVTTARTGAASRGIRTRVAIIARHTAFVELFAAILDGSPDLVFVGSAADVQAGAHVVRRTRPEILLLDEDVVGSERYDSILALASAHHPTRILVLTGSSLRPDEVTAALAAGAGGFVRKRDSVYAVLRAIRAARDGEIVVELATFESIVMAHEPHAVDGAVSGALTPRELEVLGLMARGHDPQAIAQELGIRLSTCRGYEKSILAKLDVHSQLEAVVAATERGLVRHSPG